MTTTQNTTTVLHSVGSAYASSDLRWRLQRRTGNKVWFLFDAQNQTYTDLGTHRISALAVAEFVIAEQAA